jgi:histone deacetylase 1/2
MRDVFQREDIGNSPSMPKLPLGTPLQEMATPSDVPLSPPGTPALQLRLPPGFGQGEMMPSLPPSKTQNPPPLYPSTEWKYMREMGQNPPSSGTRSGRKFGANTLEVGDQFFCAVEVSQEVGNVYEAHHVADQGALHHLDESAKRGVPRDIQQAERDPEAWQATQNEVGNMRRMKVYRLVPKSSVPKGTPVHRPVWTWTRRFDGSTKARVCFPGHRQRYGVDYFQTESPTIHLATWRTFLAYAQSRKASTRHLDITAAFLHGVVTEDVYMQQIPGFVDEDSPDHVCKLDKAMYGLKQAGRVWNIRVNKALIDFELIRHTHDPCLYYQFKNKSWLIVMLFVDDMFVTGDVSSMNTFTTFMGKQFDTKDLGPVTRFLGINVKLQPNGGYHLSQGEDIRKTLRDFKMENAKSAAEPGTIDLVPKGASDERTVNQTVYRSAVGSLYWYALATRPDILAAVNIVSQHQAQPTQSAWTAVKKILRYLIGTADLPLVIKVGPSQTLTSYADSSHGDPSLQRFSMTGGIHYFGQAAVMWGSNKQRTPAHSSAEAELVAASSVSRDALWLMHLLQPFGVAPPIHLRIDNQAVISISQSYGLIRKVKHLEIQDLCVRTWTERGLIQVTYVPSCDNLADMMTKAIKSTKLFERLRGGVMAGLRGGVSSP